MRAINDTVPYMAIHPYDILPQEFAARHLTRKAAAKLLGMRKHDLNDMIRHQRTVTPKMAKRLEQGLGIPADHWLRMQAQYERDLKSIIMRLQLPDFECLLKERARALFDAGLISEKQRTEFLNKVEFQPHETYGEIERYHHTLLEAILKLHFIKSEKALNDKAARIETTPTKEL